MSCESFISESRWRIFVVVKPRIVLVVLMTAIVNHHYFCFMCQLALVKLFIGIIGSEVFAHKRFETPI